MIPLHPQACAPDQVRWVTPPLALPFTGDVAAVPDPLAALLADGTLAEVAVEPSAVLTRLGAGHTWSVDGPRVRTALHAALDDPSGWVAAASVDVDLALYAVAREVIDTIVGPYARSHGGKIELVAAADDVVTVRIGGACRGCPAARFTLHQRLERELRRRNPSASITTER
jgi:Fe-S cluster biogenesis protein NfuA